MAEKILRARIQHKHGTEAEWNASSLIPKSGELIIFDVDDTHPRIRVAVGDGSTTAKNLVSKAVAIDSELSSTSTAAVQNKVVKAALDGKAATSHNQAANTINAMTGYSKPSSTSAIATTDTLNSAIGKLERALDSKQASGSYAAASHTHTATTGAPDKTATAAAQGHTHSVSVSGTAAAQTFTGTAVTSGAPSAETSVATSAHTHSVTAAGSISGTSAGSAVTKVEAAISDKCLTISVTTAALGSHTHTFTGSAVTSGGPSATAEVASSAHTHNVTAKGSNAASSVSATGTANATSTAAATVASSDHKHSLTTGNAA